MNNNVERIRDAMAGAILGAFISLVIFLVNSILCFAGGLLTGGSSFEAMGGDSFVALIVVLMIVGALAGYVVGYRATQDEVIRKSITKWLSKHNK